MKMREWFLKLLELLQTWMDELKESYSSNFSWVLFTFYLYLTFLIFHLWILYYVVEYLFCCQKKKTDNTKIEKEFVQITSKIEKMITNGNMKEEETKKLEKEIRGEKNLNRNIIFLYYFENITQDSPLISQFKKLILSKFNVECIESNNKIIPYQKYIFLNIIEERMDSNENKQRLSKIQSHEENSGIKWKWYNFTKKQSIENPIIVDDIWNPNSSVMDRVVLDEKNKEKWEEIEKFIKEETNHRNIYESFQSNDKK